MVENIHYIFKKNVLIFPNVASVKIGKALPLMENFKLAKEIDKKEKKTITSINLTNWQI